MSDYTTLLPTGARAARYARRAPDARRAAPPGPCIHPHDIDCPDRMAMIASVLSLLCLALAACAIHRTRGYLRKRAARRRYGTDVESLSLPPDQQQGGEDENSADQPESPVRPPSRFCPARSPSG